MDAYTPGKLHQVHPADRLADLGAETLRQLYAENRPLVVIMDCMGRNL